MRRASANVFTVLFSLRLSCDNRHLKQGSLNEEKSLERDFAVHVIRVIRGSMNILLNREGRRVEGVNRVSI